MDQLVNATSRHKLLSFMDVFLGYNYIRIDYEDEKKIAFVTEKGLYYH